MYYDHPVHALAEHTLNIDFAAPALGPAARVAVELDAESAERLVEAVRRALAARPDADRLTAMRAAYASSFDADTPLSALVIGERPAPAPPSGWTTVRVAAASLNHHDLWTLRGVGITEDRLPMILGCDAAGVDEQTGAEVVVHSVISSDGWTGDETFDTRRTLLSEKHQGTLAEFVACLRPT